MVVVASTFLIPLALSSFTPFPLVLRAWFLVVSSMYEMKVMCWKEKDRMSSYLFTQVKIVLGFKKKMPPHCRRYLWEIGLSLVPFQRLSALRSYFELSGEIFLRYFWILDVEISKWSSFDFSSAAFDGEENQRPGPEVHLMTSDFLWTVHIEPVMYGQKEYQSRQRS